MMVESIPQTESSHELVITRTFDASRALVYAAWTDPVRLERWWGPVGCDGTSTEIDRRPGGAWRAGMRSPGDAENWAHGVYREVVPVERLAMTFAWEGPGTLETLITITFEEDGDRTRMTFTHGPFESTGSRDGHCKGWNESFGKLAGYLATIA